MTEIALFFFLGVILIFCIVVTLLVADNNRIARERHEAVKEAAWCRSIVEAFIGKVKRK